MKTFMICAGLTVATLCSAWLHAAEVDRSVDALTTAISQDTSARDAINRELAPIHSKDDLARYNATAGSSSPMAVLSPLDRAVFNQSLQFGPGGLTAFDTSALHGLTTGQAYHVLALFGAQAHTIDVVSPSGVDSKASPAKGSVVTPMIQLEPIRHFRCLSAHTCTGDATAACTDNC